MFFILLTTILLHKVCSHTPKNNSDVYITYQKHSEFNDKPIFPEPPRDGLEQNKVTLKTETETATEDYGVTFEDILFVPNEKPVMRNEDLLKNEEVTESDLNKQNNGQIKVVKTDSPNEHVIFINGKNKEYDTEMKIKKETQSNNKKKSKKEAKSAEERKNVDCIKLECNNTQEPVCGGKAERNRMKYRLFLNECFFNRVNCGFKYNYNMYRKVNTSKCDQVAALNFERPSYKLRTSPIKPLSQNNTRRSFSSRRSLMIDIDGKFCSHSCPVSCTDDYDPRCAVTANGQMRVFANHCKLDFNSCLYRIVWHARPLSHCVGGRKADLQQNRRFITWMQQAGIVDKKGRMSLY